MQDLTVTMIQQPLHWLDPDANCEQFGRLISTLNDTDLIILPEMFNTGFTMQPDSVAESGDGKTLEWLSQTSQQKNSAIVASLPYRKTGKQGIHYYNRLVFMHPDGQFQHYDKRHLFRMAQEHKHYQGGKTRLIVNYKGWRICPMVCYDLRFPVWSRNKNDYDLLVYIANWPAARSEHWRTLLKARAIENLSYVAGVNIIGTDGNNISYQGDSVVHGAAGEQLLFAGAMGGCFTTRLNYDALMDYRKRFPAYMDADQFIIK